MQQELRRRRRGAGPSARSQAFPGKPTAACRPAARRPGRGARLRPQGHCRDDGRRGRRLPVSACPSTAPGPPALRSGKSATSRWRFPSGIEKICIQCGKCVLVCPHAVIRAKVYDAARTGRRAGRPSNRLRRAGKDMEGAQYTCRSRRKIAPAAPSAWRSARPRTRARPHRKAINMEAAAAAARVGTRRTGTSS